MLAQAFCVADDILRQGVVGISDIIVKPGLINVDFADVQAVMGQSVSAAPRHPSYRTVSHACALGAHTRPSAVRTTLLVAGARFDGDWDGRGEDKSPRRCSGRSLIAIDRLPHLSGIRSRCTYPRPVLPSFPRWGRLGCGNSGRDTFVAPPFTRDVVLIQATGVVFTITGASDMTLQEVNAAAQAIYEMADDEANIIFGAQIDDSMGSVLTVTVVATGFGK